MKSFGLANVLNTLQKQPLCFECFKKISSCLMKLLALLYYERYSKFLNHKLRFKLLIMLIKKKKNTCKISNIIKLQKTLLNLTVSKSLIATLNLLYHSEQSFFWQSFPMKKDKTGMPIVLVLIAASPHAKQGATSQHTTMGSDLGSDWALISLPSQDSHTLMCKYKKGLVWSHPTTENTQGVETLW